MIYISTHIQFPLTSDQPMLRFQVHRIVRTYRLNAEIAKISTTDVSGPLQADSVHAGRDPDHARS